MDDVLRVAKEVFICTHNRKKEECTKCANYSRLPVHRVAESQPEYQTLPSASLQNGMVNMSRWELSDEQMNLIMKTRSIFVYQLNAKGPVTPFLVGVTPDIVLEMPCERSHRVFAAAGREVCHICGAEVDVSNKRR